MNISRTKIIRRFLILSFVFLLLAIPRSVSAFSDIKDEDWFYENAMSLKNRGIIEGYDDGTLKPISHITHGESLKLLTSLDNIGKNPSLLDDARRLSTTAKHWADPYIKIARDRKIVHGKRQKVNPEKTATRLESAEFLIGYINTAIDSKIDPFDMVLKSSKDSYFIDAYGNSLDFLYENEIIQGSSDNGKGREFQGHRSVTRAEFLAMMDRAEKFVSKNGVKDIELEKERNKNIFEVEDFIRIFYSEIITGKNRVTFNYSNKYLDDIFNNENFNETYTDKVAAAFTYVNSSYPQYAFIYDSLFFELEEGADSFNIVIDIKSNSVGNIEAIKRREIFDKETVKLAEAFIEEGLITENMSELEKTMIIHDWIAGYLEYDFSLNPRSMDGYSALVNRKTVCMGYSALLHRLMDLFDLEIIGVTGDANGEYHIWGEAILDGKKYYIDPTWNDSSNTLEYFTTDINVFKKGRTWDADFFAKYRHLIQ